MSSTDLPVTPLPFSVGITSNEQTMSSCLRSHMMSDMCKRNLSIIMNNLIWQFGETIVIVPVVIQAYANETLREKKNRKTQMFCAAVA